MDSNTVQFVVNTLSAHFTLNTEDAMLVVQKAAAMSVPAYQKAVSLVQDTTAKIEDIKTKVLDGKIRKGVDAPAKIAALEKKLEDQNAKVAELLSRGIKQTRAPKVAAEQPVQDQPVAEAPPAKPAKVKKEKAPVAEKRIPRMSQTFTKHLENAFDTAKMEMKKTSPQEFAKYANELTQDDFDAKTLLAHMRDYVTSIARQTAPAEAPPADSVNTMSYDELARERSLLVEAYGPGIYWHTGSKTFVTGPIASDDEDVTETTMNNISYVVGDTSNRVYMTDGETDTFVGFLGIGKFANMMVPK